MSAHAQVQGIRSQLSARGMALRLDNGEYTVSHQDGRYPGTATHRDVYVVYARGLRMASERESAQRNIGKRQSLAMPYLSMRGC